MKVKKLFALVVSMALVVQLLSAVPASAQNNAETVGSEGESSGTYEVKGVTWKYGIGEAIGFNEDTFVRVPKQTPASTSNRREWHDGSMSANGEIGFIQSCDPLEDVFIFNNQKIVTDTSTNYTTPVISQVLDQQRVAAYNGSGYNWGSQPGVTQWQWPRPYQPAGQYRIINNDLAAENPAAYNRYTNFETAEVGMQWKDEEGNEWNIRTFPSRSDNVIVTYIELDGDKDLDLNLTTDHIFEMASAGGVGLRPDSDYIAEQDDDGNWSFGIVGKYPVAQRQDGTDRLFKYSGWGIATRIITDGEIDYADNMRSYPSIANNWGGGSLEDVSDPIINVSGTKQIMLISQVDRQDGGCNDVADVKTKLYDRMIEDINEVIEAYEEDSSLDYDEMLAPHADLHGEMFNSVRIDLCSTEEEKADRILTNKELIAKQNSNKNTINNTFLERVYYNGRFGLICASGYGSSRLGGIWNGTWMPQWSGDYTLDANTNLQISGMNTGNMEGASKAYVDFILRMVDDWMVNAKNIYGIDDAIMAPPRVDGAGDGTSYHHQDPYPHIYVNGIGDWLLIPIFEYWQSYGDRQISIGKDISVEKLANVLDLDENDITRIEENGYFNLLEDILLPLLNKNMNFWLGYVDERFYTDEEGVDHLNDGTTIDEGGQYLYSPGYSPENAPGQYGENSVQSLAYNTTMDIAASKDSLFMARAVLEAVGQQEPEEWGEFESRIPKYEYVPENKSFPGALKEWASLRLEEGYRHRHASHAYPAWPAYESQGDNGLTDAIAIAMDARTAAYSNRAAESHSEMHKSLIEARLGRADELEGSLLYLLTSNYQYSSFMTNHNANKTSSFCTDSAFGIPGAINESLVYSNTGEVKVLPTLIDTMNIGSVRGLRTRSQAVLEELKWNKDRGTVDVVINSEIDQTIEITNGDAWDTAVVSGCDATVIDGEKIILNMQVGETATIQIIEKLITKQELAEVINTANAELAAKAPEVYPVPLEEVNQALESVVNEAQSIYDNEDSTEEQVIDIYYELLKAIEVFEAAYVFPLSIDLPSGVYTAPQTLKIEQNEHADTLEIRYTVDGSEPTAEAFLYTGQLRLPRGVANIKAAQFVKETGEQFGDTAEGSYMLIIGTDYALSAMGTTASVEPDTFWSGNPVTNMFNGNSTDRWAGRGSGGEWLITVDLGQERTINTLLIDGFVDGNSNERNIIIDFAIEYLDSSNGEWDTVYEFFSGDEDSQGQRNNADLMLRGDDGNIPKSHEYYGVHFPTVTAQNVRVRLLTTREASIYALKMYNLSTADFTELETLIEEAEKLEEADYVAGWAALQEAYETAVYVRDDGEAAQEQVNEASNALREAIENLVPYVAVTGIKLDHGILTMKTGTVNQLSATVLPEDASNKNIIWSSSDNNIVRVIYGNLIAGDEGLAVITAVTEEGGFKAQCIINVTDEEDIPDVDKTRLERVVTNAELLQAEMIESGDYDKLNTLAKQNFEDALTYAIEVINDESVSQDDVDDAWKALIYAIGYLSDEYESDNSRLVEAIEQAMYFTEQILDTYYTYDSAAVFKAALQEAEDGLTDLTNLTSDFNQLADALISAIQGLELKQIVPELNLENLRKAIDLAEDYETRIDEYMDGTAKDTFYAELQNAKNTYDAPLSQEDIDGAETALLDAIQALRLKADKEKLKALLGEAEVLNLELYTDASVAALNQAAANARAVYYNVNALQDEVEEAEDILERALMAMQLKDDQTEDSETEDLESKDNESKDSETKDNESKDSDSSGSTDKKNDSEANESKGSSKETSSKNISAKGTNSSPKTGDTSAAYGFMLLTIVGIGTILLMKRKLRR